MDIGGVKILTADIGGSRRTISAHESIYLDLVRSVAAMAVVLDHYPAMGLNGYGHLAVIVFFVLSGYVISATTHRTATVKSFMIARLSRLWSVVVPAIFLTLFCDIASSSMENYSDNQAPWDHAIVRIATAVTFTAQSWISVQPGSNFAMWSVCCEFWYYVAFCFYSVAGRWSSLGVAVSLAMMGPMGLALFPVWLIGACLSRFQFRPTHLTSLFIMCVAVASTIFLFCIISPMVQIALADVVSVKVYLMLNQARVFPVDWLMGVFVGIHLVAARGFCNSVKFSEWLSKLIRWFAGSTFVAYLFHEPLLRFWHAAVPGKKWTVLLLTLTIILLSGHLIEGSKKHWKRILTLWSDRLLPAT